MQTNHQIKIDSDYFRRVVNKTKTFEIRKNDRDYKEGDKVMLDEYKNGEYTGSTAVAKIGFVTDFEQKEGYVVFSLLHVTRIK